MATKKTKKKSKGAAALKEVTAEAKRIYKNSKGMKWQTAMKRAGVAYRKKNK